jgi:hypothetical protein
MGGDAHFPDDPFVMTAKHQRLRFVGDLSASAKPGLIEQLENLREFDFSQFNLAHGDLWLDVIPAFEKQHSVSRK